jgi:hypothetical protein
MNDLARTRCPYCAEEILASAAKCRWCGEFVKPGARPRRAVTYRPADSQATTILVLGILGFVLCGVLGMFAWSKGNDYLRQCRELRVEPSGAAVAGRILGMVATILILVQVGLVILLLGLTSVR